MDCFGYALVGFSSLVRSIIFLFARFLDRAMLGVDDLLRK